MPIKDFFGNRIPTFLKPVYATRPISTYVSQQLFLIYSIDIDWFWQIEHLGDSLNVNSIFSAPESVWILYATTSLYIKVAFKDNIHGYFFLHVLPNWCLFHLSSYWNLYHSNYLQKRFANFVSIYFR